MFPPPSLTVFATMTLVELPCRARTYAEFATILLNITVDSLN